MALETAFAPAERAPADCVRRQHDALVALPYVREFLDAVPNMSLVLNEHRQIVFGNRAFVTFLNGRGQAEATGQTPGDVFGDSLGRVLGQRPGEAVGCIHSRLTAGGCGTTPFCRTCGAVISILNSQQFHREDVQECQLVAGDAGGNQTAMELRVWSRPIQVGAEGFTVFSVVDISHEKRRQALERIFFHDVTNTAGCIKSLTDLMTQPEMRADQMQEMMGMIAESADQLLEEISAQAELSAAESGDLKPELKTVQSLELLPQIVHLFHCHPLAKDKTVAVVAGAEVFTFVSDPMLLRRVLINLVKNALEAETVGGTVTLSCHGEANFVSFTVQNWAVMPPAVQLQIFNRSFTTKGRGRGLGTYSIKLLSEKYLKGQVAFVSSVATGTRFTVHCPR